MLLNLNDIYLFTRIVQTIVTLSQNLILQALASFTQSLFTELSTGNVSNK